MWFYDATAASKRGLVTMQLGHFSKLDGGGCSNLSITVSAALSFAGSKKKYPR